MQSMTRVMGAAALLLFVVLLPGALPAAESPPPDAPATPDPAMEQLLRMANQLSALQAFGVSLQTGYDVVQESGQKIEFGEQRELTLVRPDRFRVEVTAGDGGESVTLFDGKTLTLYDKGDGVYASTEHPGDIDATIGYFVKDLQLRLPLALLFVTDLPRELERRVTQADIVETTRIGGTPCLHIAARTETVDFQVWLPVSGDALPRRIVLTYKDDEGQPQFWADFSDWNLSPDTDVSRFRLAMPEGATRIPFLAKLHPAGPVANQGDQP